MGAPLPSRPRLIVAGELDSAGAIRLGAQLDTAIAPGVDLTLDLSAVEHLSADALTVLVPAYRRLRGGGGSLVLDEVSTPVGMSAASQRSTAASSRKS